jgi:LysW-gamma-L-lysine carboxypeptidase
MKFIRKTGTSDMNIFGNKIGIPIATYGPGNGHLSHTSNEYIDIAEYLTSIEVYKTTIKNLLKIKRKNR